MKLHSMKRHLCTVQGCAVYSDIGPYIAMLANDAHASVQSIYRGQDAARLLHRHGKHTQAELYSMAQKGIGNPANPPGRSTHELKSDAVAYPGYPRGHGLLWWMQGFDVNDSDTGRMIAQARVHGWTLFRPYPSGSEFHHLNFKSQPRLGVKTRPRIFRLRVTLPT